MSTSPKPHPRPTPNNSPAVINAHEAYLFEEFARRLRWRKHSCRQAKKMGLRTVRFGSRDYVLGQWGLDFLESLDKQGDSEA